MASAIIGRASIFRPYCCRFFSSSGEIPTIKEVRSKLKDIVGAQKLWGETTPGRASMPAVTMSQSELPVKRSCDSYLEAIVPLSDPVVRENYLTFLKTVRFGRILEDLDTFAVAVSYTHNKDPSQAVQKSPVSIVTALVDRIDLKKHSIQADSDLKIKGNVTWVGTSSMEITIHIEQFLQGAWDPILNAQFLMVARNPETKKGAPICPLQPQGEEEEELFRKGQAAKQIRLEEASRSLLKTPPNEIEREAIHDIFLQTIDPKAATFKVRVKPEESVWMQDTILKNVIICHPQERNLYNKIFGGFLMRQAFELGWINAYQFCKSRPVLTTVDDIAFKRSVEIGSVLFFSSQVVYSEGSQMQVKVHAEVVDLGGAHETSNIFYFTLCTADDTPVPKVFPRTYAESMMYLDGKRHFES